MSRVVVGKVGEIPEGGRKIVNVRGRSVGVFKVDGEYYALLDRCPHKGADLCSSGTIFGISNAEGPTEEIEYEPRRSIRCPWHQWEFDIRTGVSFYDPENDRVRKYNVEVVPGSEVCSPSDDPDAPQYIAEGYEVEVEDDVIVINTSRRRAGVGPGFEKK